MAVIRSAFDVTRPQCAYTSVGQDTHKNNLFLNIYAGLLHVNHAAGGDPTEQDIEFPLVYITEDEAVRVIDAWHDPRRRPSEFRSAIANCSISGFVDKTDPAIVHILSARADLREVTLNPSGKTIFAVVLAMRVKAQNAEFPGVGYQVTVMWREPKGTLAGEFFTNTPDWDGTYAHISPIVAHGEPQRA
jgi:hypothetical protein